MTDRNLSIRVAFNAINNLTRPASAAQKSAASLAAQINATQSSLKGLERNASSFDRLSRAAEKTANHLNEAKKKAQGMRASFGPASQRTAEQTTALKQQTDTIRQLTRAQNEERVKLSTLRTSMMQHGVLLKGGSSATEQIARRTAEYNRQLSDQQRRLAATSRAQANYQRAKEQRDSLYDGGAKAIATGAIVAVPVAKAVSSYASFEDSMKDVAKQVNGLRDNNGNRTAQFYEMQKEIKAASETLPLQNGAQDYAALVAGGARMGVSNGDDPWEKQKADLLSFATTAAMAAKAFELPADQLSENLGKIAGLYKVPTRNIEQLGDAINYLDDNAKSKGLDIIDVLQRVGGIADKLDYRKAAALGSTFLTLGAAPEIAASATNAMVRELSIATTQGKNFFEGINTLGLSADKIQKAMPVDAMGTIITVLEAAKKLTPDKQTSVLTQIFGKEFGDDAAKLANNLPELYRQLQLVNGEASKGSMRRESDIDKDSVSSQWMMTKASTENAFSSLGETLRGPAMEVMKYVTGIVQKFRAWSEANPAIVAALMKMAVVISVALAMLGALALAIGSILVPMGAMRLGLTLLNGGRGFGGLPLSIEKLAARLKNLSPMLSGTGSRVQGWLPIFRSATSASKKLGSTLLSSGKNGFGMMVRMGNTAGTALTTLFTSPRNALAALGNGLRLLATGGFGTLLTIGRTVLTVLGGGLSVLLSPIGLLIAAVAGAALLVWKYWGPIKSFFSGFWDGLLIGLAPIKQALDPLEPIFDKIGSAIGRVWNWFKQLFEPANSSAQTLRDCTEAGQTFGEVVGKAITGVIGVVLKVAEGIGWLLKKLGAIPEAANSAKEVAGAMDAATPYKPRAPVQYVWDQKLKKMVAQEWHFSPPSPAPKMSPASKTPPVTPPASKITLDSLKGSNIAKKKKSDDDSAASVSAATRDPHKLGDIVFKNRPPVLAVSGQWKESLTSQSQPQSGNRLTDLVRGVTSWPARALNAALPVPVIPKGKAEAGETTSAQQSANAALSEVINLTVNIYEAGKQDQKSLTAMVRRELENLLRERDKRRRSQLKDSE